MAGLACEQHGRHSPEERHCRLSIREHLTMSCCLYSEEDNLYFVYFTPRKKSVRTGVFALSPFFSGLNVKMEKENEEYSE